MVGPSLADHTIRSVYPWGTRKRHKKKVREKVLRPVRGTSHLVQDAPCGGRPPQTPPGADRTHSEDDDPDDTARRHSLIDPHLGSAPADESYVGAVGLDCPWPATPPGSDLHAHRIRTSQDKLEDVVGLSPHPPEHAVVLCVDENSQIHALDRTQPGLPMKKSRCGTRPHDDKCHGTPHPLCRPDCGRGFPSRHLLAAPSAPGMADVPVSD